MAGKQITIDKANAMINNYVGHVRGLAIEQKKKTEYVTFTLPELMAWLKEVEPYSNELKVCLGIHPPDSKHEPDRLTVVLWAYKSGQPAFAPEGKDGGGGAGFNPYNEGNSGP